MKIKLTYNQKSYIEIGWLGEFILLPSDIETKSEVSRTNKKRIFFRVCWLFWCFKVYRYIRLPKTINPSECDHYFSSKKDGTFMNCEFCGCKKKGTI